MFILSATMYVTGVFSVLDNSCDDDDDDFFSVHDDDATYHNTVDIRTPRTDCLRNDSDRGERGPSTSRAPPETVAGAAGHDDRAGTLEGGGGSDARQWTAPHGQGRWRRQGAPGTLSATTVSRLRSRFCSQSLASSPQQTRAWTSQDESTALRGGPARPLPCLRR